VPTAGAGGMATRRAAWTAITAAGANIPISIRTRWAALKRAGSPMSGSKSRRVLGSTPETASRAKASTTNSDTTPPGARRPLNSASDAATWAPNR